MAVSLVSTGVQFPDASIQTTAAGASAATVVQSINFTSQASFSLALDFATYPGGYQLIWNNVQNSSSGNANLIEWSGNNGSSYSAFGSGNYTIAVSTGSYNNQLNYSGYWGYSSNNYGGYGTGSTVVMQLAAKSNAATTSAVTMSFTGYGQGPDPRPIFGGSYYYTYGAQAFTNVRFSWSGGTFSAGAVRILGYK